MESAQQKPTRLQISQTGYQYKEIDSIMQKLSVESKTDVNAWDFTELCLYLTRIFGLLGVVGKAMKLAFKDITTKSAIVRTHLERRPNCTHIFQLIQEELDTNFKVCGDQLSVARTVLRLMWFCDYLYEILNGLASTDKKTSTICIEGYDKALGPHHPMALRWLAKACMYAAPGRDSFTKLICESTDPQVQRDLMSHFCIRLLPIKEMMWQFYTQKNLTTIA